ncbi:cyclopentanone -monooxygenase [Colletotrichum incanum]|uniref:Cyclopentanone-monooxygenase n=1 Tax=Colletotrichum incanum TaxID=1573173 RepID=A0A161WMK6_COLIC|nr:cyclopentanone -monooxygenase [Colletotrichum incanum]
MGSIDQLDNGRLNGSGVQNGTSNQELDYEVLIIGGGFGGCYALHQMRKHGFQAHIVEAGSALGGVWHWNRYPGARVDSEAPYYQLSVREVWKDWTWSQRFPGHEELRRYFQHIDKALDISKDVSYDTVVVGADFDTETSRWILIKRHEPKFPGKETFKGMVAHSAASPKSGIDFQNRRVAIIGTGATGVQCVQEIAKVPGVQLTVYVRNINITLPMRQRELPDLEQRSLKAIYPTLFKAAKDSFIGIPNDGTTKATNETTAEERDAWWEELWQRGAFNFQSGQYSDFLVDPEANRLVYEFWVKKTRTRMRNPEKSANLVPNEQPFPVATKRSSLEQDYYECMDQDNVEVVDVKKMNIREWTPQGIITEDGREREHDIIVLATGYDSVTGALTSMGLRGKDGVDMKERWKDGVWTYLGLMAQGCPNMFMICGPQAPTALTNGPPFIEQQVELIAEILAKLRKEQVRSIEPRQSAMKDWKNTVLDINEASLFTKNESLWYMGANIPGKKREQLNYLGGIPEYIKACKEGTSDWGNFEIIMDDGAKKKRVE